MTEPQNQQATYPSDDKTLAFVERMRLASGEKKELQREYEQKKKLEADDILNTVDKFISTICNPEDITQKFIESVHKTNTRRKVVELYSFNYLPELGEIYNKEIESVGVEGKRYSTKYILSEGYTKLTQKYFPDRSKSIIDKISEILNTEAFNNGVDLETNEKLIPCIFVNKKRGSKFRNGVYISRDGIDYNNSNYNTSTYHRRQDNGLN